ncbi:hypothetical protein CI109_105879 [Kwoniella shandongensis]|uniref:TROVE domain-containing protein n=1 Tax=Kwoniella shandongensis TaxID=1734106 RepID=A0A5M6BY46_9TREE|nr:uncharacterized protein CI109_005686 [Kwoniella shandongensis]KAA5525939.1 hypothetical protein CI109_005686 [Kwoniella shandongensis]
MAAPLQKSMSELDLRPPPSGPSRTTPKKKMSKKDWSLPPTFLSLLATPPQQLYDTLLPAKDDSLGQNDSAAPKTSAPTSATSAFIDTMKRIPNTTTEKGALAYDSTQSPLVDLFFDLAPGIQASHLYELLDKAWKEDPLAMLKIVFHARSIHEGKGFKEGFFRAIGWIWDEHPRTLLENLELIVKPTCQRQRDDKRDSEIKKRREEKAMNGGDGVVELDESGEVDLDEKEPPEYPPRPHGSFDDLIALLVLHINGQLSSSYTGPLSALDESLAPSFQAQYFKQSRVNFKSGKDAKRDRGGFQHIIKAAKKDKDSFKAKIRTAPDGAAKHRLLHERSNDALTNDKKYRALYITILHLFAKYIKADLSLLDKHKDFISISESQHRSSIHLFGMSYAAKWVPTPAHGADRQTFFATALSMFLFPGDGVNWSRQKLQKEILTPLRKVLSVPEVEMSNGTWNIDYTKVPSKSMARNSDAFWLHDRKGFEAYIDKVSKGQTTISGASLMPHEVLIDATQGKTPIQKRLGDLQWTRLVDSIRSSSKTPLSNCIAIADVSGSMGSIDMQVNSGSKKAPAPILPCVALTLLLGELAAPPWNGCFFTFSADPTCEFIEPSLPLSEKASQLSRASWGMSTNFYKVFDLILETAKRESLAPENMVKKLFVFSDMQFDSAADGTYGETEHHAIQRKFKESGYPMPELVYWNLASRDEGAPKPVLADTEGVSLFSGFSAALMKYFLGQADLDADGDAKMEGADDDYEEIGADGETVEKKDVEVKEKKKDNPLDVVLEVISAESFSELRVVD